MNSSFPTPYRGAVVEHQMPSVSARPVMRPWERTFHILTMITQFGGILPVFLALSGGSDAKIGSSSPINTVMTSIILVVTVYLAYTDRANLKKALPSMLPVITFLGFALLSTIWSDDPDITMRRCGTACTTALWGAYLASRFNLRETIILIAQSVGIIAVASLLVGILMPSVGVADVLESDPGGVPGWRGIVGDKNSLGIVMATGMVTMVYLVISPGHRKVTSASWLVCAAFCSVLLYLSQSRTSWIAAIVGLIVAVVVRFMYRRPGVGIIIWASLLLVGIPILFYAINDLGSLTAVFGKDATLTGRVDLWQTVLPYGARRPWLGYGYAAFWVEDSPMTQAIWRELNSYHPPHAHNGWIETYLELGLIGCAIVGTQVALLLIQSTRAVISGRDVDAPYMLLITTVMLVFNMVENDLIRAPALFWPFLIIGPVALGKVLRSERVNVVRGNLRPWNKGPGLPPGATASPKGPRPPDQRPPDPYPSDRRLPGLTPAGFASAAPRFGPGRPFGLKPRDTKSATKPSPVFGR